MEQPVRPDLQGARLLRLLRAKDPVRAGSRAAQCEPEPLRGGRCDTVPDPDALTRLAGALGARPETLSGLSGLGDLSLTCNSGQSRNFALGHALGAGRPVTRPTVYVSAPDDPAIQAWLDQLGSMDSDFADAISTAPVVLGRGKDGALFALRDRCPHRGMALSKGKFDGDTLMCPFHGWRFGTALEPETASGAVTTFRPVNLEVLVDSPMFAGVHYRQIDLDPGGRSPVRANLVADHGARRAGPALSRTVPAGEVLAGGAVDAVVNNAGGALGVDPVAEGSAQDMVRDPRVVEAYLGEKFAKRFTVSSAGGEAARG